MFAKIAVSLSTFALLATAIPTGSQGISQCNTGSTQCCASVQKADSPGVSTLLGLLGILNNVAGEIGFSCTPISVVGLGQGANCAQTPACCEGNTFNGIVNLGCTPISL